MLHLVFKLSFHQQVQRVQIFLIYQKCYLVIFRETIRVTEKKNQPVYGCIPNKELSSVPMESHLLVSRSSIPIHF